MTFSGEPSFHSYFGLFLIRRQMELEPCFLISFRIPNAHSITQWTTKCTALLPSVVFHISSIINWHIFLEYTVGQGNLRADLGYGGGGKPKVYYPMLTVNLAGSKANTSTVTRSLSLSGLSSSPSNTFPTSSKRRPGQRSLLRWQRRGHIGPSYYHSFLTMPRRQGKQLDATLAALMETRSVRALRCVLLCYVLY